MARQKLYGDEPTVRINVIIKATHNEQLKELAAFEGRSVADLIREIVDTFLDKKNEDLDKRAERRRRRQHR